MLSVVAERAEGGAASVESGAQDYFVHYVGDKPRRV